MKSQGRTAWLITWEGPEAEHYGRCKIVTILRPQLIQSSIASLLPILFSSEYNYTLCEKLGCIVSRGKDPFLYIAYKQINKELWYGHFPKHFLRARKVKNLRCEESKLDCFESTLYWTELAKFIPNPEHDFNGPLPDDLAKLVRQVVPEREAHYTYSIRPCIEERKARKANIGPPIQRPTSNVEK